MKHIKVFEEFSNDQVNESSMSLSMYYKDFDKKVKNTAKEIDGIINTAEFPTPKSKDKLLDLITDLVEDYYQDRYSEEGWNENKKAVTEAKNSIYPEEVQKIIDGLVGIGLMKKYQSGAFTNYGVWFIELPASSISITNIKRIEKIIPDFSIGTYVGYSGLSLRTNISV